MLLLNVTFEKWYWILRKGAERLLFDCLDLLDIN